MLEKFPQVSGYPASEMARKRVLTLDRFPDPLAFGRQRPPGGLA